MSDEWIYYPCQMGEHSATVMVDGGVAETLDDIAPPHLLQVRVTFKRPRADGFYEKDETDALNRLDDDLAVLAADHQSLYVGRITTNGARHYYVYTPDDSAEQWSRWLEEFGGRHGYSLDFFVGPDAKQEGYWNELYPTEDDWQVIRDLSVLDSLAQSGDDPDVMRTVDHMVYFQTETAANEFGVWASAQGYEVEEIAAHEGNEYRVRFTHQGTVQLGDITGHTLAISHQAQELGGEYDGWGTVVCSREEK